jgi:hypothetical protein
MKTYIENFSGMKTYIGNFSGLKTYIDKICLFGKMDLLPDLVIMTFSEEASALILALSI